MYGKDLAKAMQKVNSRSKTCTGTSDNSDIYC